MVLAWPAMTDPVSWLQIRQGWSVITSDGVVVGTVAQVEGDKQADIFDGLAVESTSPAEIRYVPGEQVGPIRPGEVTLRIASADLGTLEPFHDAAAANDVATREAAAHDPHLELAARETVIGQSVRRPRCRTRRGLRRRGSRRERRRRLVGGLHAR